jgi:hypothetical protein
MNNPDATTVIIRCGHEMWRLGRAFGALFLNPLLKSKDPELQSLVVATYGHRKSGKSSFLYGCSDGLFLKKNWIPRRSRYIQQTQKNNGEVYRYLDFGWYAFSDRDDYEKPPTRKEIAQRGVDLFEHAALSNVGAGALVSIIDPERVYYTPQYQSVISTILNIKTDLSPHQDRATDFLLNSFSSERINALHQTYENPQPFNPPLKKNNLYMGKTYHSAVLSRTICFR